MKRLGLTMLSASFGFLLVACAGTRPTTLGHDHGRLAPCPKSPNCVSSQAADSSHAIAPLAYGDSMPNVMDGLVRVIEAMPRTHIVTRTDEYLHAEFTSALFRFVDDVEFVIEAAARKIHVRSASRLGYSDLGANRRRIEAIRAKFTENAR